MMSMLRTWKYLINVVLLLIAIGLEVFYTVCGGSCSYLRGNIFGMDLTYVGIIFAVILIVLSLLKWDRLILVLLSAGVGVETVLVAFQVRNNVYCPYCLAFAAVILLLFILNFDVTKKGLITGSIVLGFVLFSLFFKGSVTPSYAAEPTAFSFGNGPVKVRLYTDYFCSPCRAMEPEVEPLLIELVKKNAVTLAFIDVPIYQYSSLYARYYLYAMNARKDFDQALAARSALFEAAGEKLSEVSKIEAYLKKKDVQFKTFDVVPLSSVLNGFLASDKINSTPTCVIENGPGKETYKGSRQIIPALKQLR